MARKAEPEAPRQCYHCKKLVEPGESHDCWTTTPAALTAGLSEDLRDAWDRLHETALTFGDDQRVYASHNSIMFSRRTCYFFVRPNRRYLEVCFFLGRTLSAPQVRRVQQASKTKLVHTLRITHRDEVEPPITDWLQEAYDYNIAALTTTAPNLRSESGPPRSKGKKRAATKTKPASRL